MGRGQPTDRHWLMRPVRVSPAVLACVATLSACGSSKNDSATTSQSRTKSAIASTTPAPSEARRGRSGCGKSASGTSTLSLRIAGRSRVVVVHVPKDYTGSEQIALVLNMHGTGSTAAEQEAFTGMDVASDTYGFVVAYPQADIPDGTGFDWNVPNEPLFGGRPVPADAPDDVAFLTALVGILEDRYCIDSSRVYATGFSGGARMASQLACDESGVFAAVAPVSGLRRPTPCPTGRVVPVISFHGTADPVDPYNGHGQRYWTYSVPQAVHYWATQDGCSSSPTTTHPLGGITLTAYGGCGAPPSARAPDVELYTISGEGHEWPGGPALPRSLTRVLGPQTTVIDANELMWSFFESHPLR